MLTGLYSHRCLHSSAAGDWLTGDYLEGMKVV